MGTIKEGEYVRRSSSNSVDSTRTSTWKKKRLSRLNETKVYIFTSICIHANAYIYHDGIYILILNASKMFIMYVHLELYSV